MSWCGAAWLFDRIELLVQMFCPALVELFDRAELVLTP
jgi:hypothetical protein